MVAVGAGLLLVVGLVVASLLRSAGNGLRVDYLSLAQQQVELVRIADIGVSKADQAEAKNLAVTTKYTVTSQQPAVQNLAKQAGVATAAKNLALGKDATVDTKLTSADQANQFDAVFTETLRTKLQRYQQTLKKIYDSTGVATTKNTLSNDYAAVDLLLGTKE